jgi:glycosyltransferase involved in cell wall biosynthesis
VTGRDGRAQAASRVRVALVTASLVAGGAERQMLLLAEGLPHDAFAVEFICLKLAGEDAQRARAAGATVRVLGLKGKRESGWPLPLYAVYVAWKVGRFIGMAAARRYDVIDAWLFHAYALATITRPFTRPRAVLAGRRSLSEFKAQFGRPERLADALARRGSDLLVANSEAVKADVVGREGVAPDRIRVIHNGVQLAESMTVHERRRRRAAWAATDDTIVIGCVANYKPFKGLELLIGVIANLAVRLGHRRLRLVLVGEGILRPMLEALQRELEVEDLVILHGAEPVATRVYAAFDIAALASEAEGLPNVVLEAAAAGLPIVATAAGGTPEVISDGVTGLLVDVGDEEGFTDALERLCRDRAAAERLGAAARSDVAQRFGVDQMVAAFASLYREVSEPTRRRAAGL